MDSVEVNEVFYSLSPNEFLVKNTVKFTGKNPFVILDIVIAVGNEESPEIEEEQQPDDAFVVGDLVEARTMKGWEPAQIKAVNGDGTFNVKFTEKKTQGTNWRPSNV